MDLLLQKSRVIPLECRIDIVQPCQAAHIRVEEGLFLWGVQKPTLRTEIQWIHNTCMWGLRLSEVWCSIADNAQRVCAHDGHASHHQIFQENHATPYDRG